MPPTGQNLFRALSHRVARRAARGYIVGDDVGDAIGACRRLAGEDIRSSVGYWNREGEPAGEVFDECVRIVAHLACLSDRPYVSIKAPALDLRRDLIEQIARTAAGRGVRVHFDSHGPETADATFALVEAARCVHPVVGCSLPGRWARSERDAEWAAETGLCVRVVKGQWDEGRAAARDPRAGFLAVVERLAGRARQVGVATHDPGLAALALERLLAAGTPCELELLYGLPMEAPLAVAARLGVASRVYVPYGEAFLPYAWRYARRNPRIVWWLIRDAFRRRRTIGR